MSRQNTVAVIDDHPVVRKGITQTFNEEEDFRVLAEGESADDAVRIARELNPDIIILDVNMPGGGVEAAAAINRMQPTIKLLMLSIREDLAIVRAALKAGALGYVSKGVSSADLIASARTVLTGNHSISAALAARLILGESERPPNPVRQPPDVLQSLTSREKELLDLVGEGLSNQVIAKRSGLSENTVKHYMTSLLMKLGVRNRTEAALLARGVGPSNAG